MFNVSFASAIDLWLLNMYYEICFYLDLNFQQKLVEKRKKLIKEIDNQFELDWIPCSLDKDTTTSCVNETSLSSPVSLFFSDQISNESCALEAMALILHAPNNGN